MVSCKGVAVELSSGLYSWMHDSYMHLDACSMRTTLPSPRALNLPARTGALPAVFAIQSRRNSGSLTSPSSPC